MVDEHLATLESAAASIGSIASPSPNASGPTSLFRSVGGFDERFVEYGSRNSNWISAAGADVTISSTVTPSPGTDVVSRQPDDCSQLSRRRDSARSVRLHPEAEESVFPNEPSPAMALLRRIHVRRPQTLAAGGSSRGKGCPSLCFGPVEGRVKGRTHRLGGVLRSRSGRSRRHGTVLGAVARRRLLGRHATCAHRQAGALRKSHHDSQKQGTEHLASTALSIDPPVGTATACAPGAPT